MTSDEDTFTKARNYLNCLFQTSDPQASCLSVVSHDLHDSRDLRCHFFGCLGIDKRVEVLNDAKHPIWKQAERLEKENTDPQVRGSKSPYPNQQDDDDERLDMRYITALNLQAELKRIAVLRRTPALKGLVRQLRESIDNWKDKNGDNIKKVHDFRIDSHTWDKSKPPGPLERVRRQSQGQLVSRPGTRRISRTAGDTTRDVSRRPELDKILPEFSQTLQDIIKKKCWTASESDSEESAAYDLKRDIKARLVKLKRPEPTDSDAKSFTSSVMEPDDIAVDDKIFKGSFPDQQVSIFHLLDQPDGPGKFKRQERHAEENSAEKACPCEMSYYHIPSNNMSWVEEAIATYFNKNSTEYGQSFQSCPQTRLVLQDGYWRGQEHGGGPGSVVHTRNLRPLCEKIPTNVEDLYRSGESTQKGLVLFMPFLHWETDRRRDQVADLIEQLTDEHEFDKRETSKMWKSKRKEDRKGLDPAVVSSTSVTPDYKEPDYYRPRGRDRDNILQALAAMLWAKIGDGVKKNMPPGLPHTLWQRIRGQDHGNQLLVALEKIVYEIADDLRNDPILRPLVYEQLRGGTLAMREWTDILWAIKEAGMGSPTPHALEDIFWEEIKKVRRASDELKRSRNQDDHKERDLSAERVFHKDTAIFAGVDLDEYGHLQPTNHLAKVLVRAARLYELIMTYPDQKIMEEYLFKYPPLHPRRTLDQAYFWRLRDTRLRDRDQVVYRYTNADFAHKYRPQPPSDPKNDRSSSSVQSRGMYKAPHGDKTKQDNWVWTRHGQYEEDNGCLQCDDDIRKVSRAIMVDQLWMWILDNDTILTCFPQRYGMTDKDPSGVHQSIRMRVKTRTVPENHVRSVLDLALIILEECFDSFFNRARTADKRPQVMDMFAESIGRVTNRQAVAFKHLWTLSERLTRIYQSGVEEKVDSDLLLALLNVTPEAELQREIRDIIDELDIILHIAKQQQEMIKRFVRFATDMIEADVNKYKESPYDKMLPEQQSVFKSHSEILLSDIEDRVNELSGLKSSAESTAQNVNDLLGLKQQQASVVQAYEAMKQGEETVRQGKAIMIFTVLTIIFLPLSFMSSLFGMNAVELTGNDPSPGTSDSNDSGPVPDEIVPFWPTTFKRQILVMFTVSFGAVLLVIIPAFSPFIRASMGSAFNQFISKTITWTGMYKLWLRSGWNSKDVRDGARENVSKMKRNVREELYRQERLASEIRDRVRTSTGELLSTKKMSGSNEGRGDGGVGFENATNGAIGPRAVGLGSALDLEKGS